MCVFLLKIRRLRLLLGLFLSSLLLCIAFTTPLSAPAAQAVEPVALVQQGVSAYAAGHYKEAKENWEAALALKFASRNALDSSNRQVVLENLAQVSTQLGQLPASAHYWQQALEIATARGDRNDPVRLKIEMAQAYSRLGQHRRAITLLCDADRSSQSNRPEPAAIEQCSANSLLAQAQTLNQPSLQLFALGSLGEAHSKMGNYPAAQGYLEAALELSESLMPGTAEAGAALNQQLAVLQALGSLRTRQAQLNLRRAAVSEEIGDMAAAQRLSQQGESQQRDARQYLEQGLNSIRSSSAGNTESHPAALKAELTFLQALLPLENGDLKQSQSFRQAVVLLGQLPDSQSKAFSAIRLAQLLGQPKATAPSGSPGSLLRSRPAESPLSCPASEAAETEALLKTGLAVARRIGDFRAESFALGQLGHLAECRGDMAGARSLTLAARNAATQDSLGGDSLYLWDWQLGRIWQRQGQRDEAVGAYQAAIAELDSIRSDLLTSHPELRFDFRDSIEPLYRNLTALELSHIPAHQLLAAQSNPSQTLGNALTTVDALKLTELQNYFGSDCIIAPSQTTVLGLEAAQPNTAVISTVILADRTAVIASFPDGTRQLEWVDQPQAEVEATVNELRGSLESYFFDFEPSLAQAVYGWLVQPFEQQLAAHQVSTLVFVQDGILRSLPMAALHDGQGFLIERFAIATTPSLELTDPKALEPEELQALALGLSDEVTVQTAITAETIDFEPLPFVREELQALSQRLPQTELLLNQDFSRDRLQARLAEQRYPIVHVATHGQFGAEPDRNFIVMGDGETLTISELDQLIRQLDPGGRPIELLALTACETAVGDERATLGLAGVAVRAGARSALASLWLINDAATAELVEQFYQGLLDPQFNRAEALQAAQVALIQQGGEMAHPARWAPLILVGSWL